MSHGVDKFSSLMVSFEAPPTYNFEPMSSNSNMFGVASNGATFSVFT